MGLGEFVQQLISHVINYHGYHTWDSE